jgi:uncharacterized membrane protein
MQSKTFSIGEALKVGYRSLKDHFWFFASTLILGLIIIIIPLYFSDKFQAQSPAVGFLFWLIYVVLSTLLQIGYVKISLNIIDKNKSNIWNLVNGINLFFNYLIANILYNLILFAGLLLLVFPMFIWATKFGFFPYLVVDKKLGPIKALKASAKLSHGAKWDIFCYYIAAYLLVLLGVLAVGIGLFATLPIVLVSAAWIYRQLLKQTESLDVKI